MSAAIVQAACRFMWRCQLPKAGVGTHASIRSEIARAAFSSETAPDIGATVSAAHSDGDTVARIFDMGTVIVVDALFNVIAIPIVLLSLNPTLAMLTLAPLPFISVLVSVLDARVRKAHARVQEGLSRLSSMAESTISNIRMVRINTAESPFLNSFSDESERYFREGQGLTVVESIYGPGLEFFISLSLVSLMVWGGEAVLAEGVTIGTFLAFQKYIEQLQWPMRALALGLTTVRKSSTSAARIRNFIASTKSLASRDSIAVQRLDDGEVQRPIVEVQALHVQLPGTQQAQLKGISFKVMASERIAIVGPVGSGKSTLLWSLVGMNTAAKGQVSLLGSDASSMPPSQLHELVTLVPQEVFLFGLSIRENLLFGLPQKYSGNVEQALRDALECAAIREEVEALPRGLETILGERGLSLSGGQRQRLSLARALLRGSEVLLLDNSLSAVDAETETLILNRLKGLPCVVICVTHRLSTVTALDRVLLFEDGLLAQDTTTVEMLERPQGWLKLFCESQRAERLYQDFVEQIPDE